MYQDVLIDPRKMIVHQFLYTVIPLGPTTQVLKWVPLDEPKIVSLSNGDRSLFVRALILNAEEMNVTNLPLPTLGITIHPINSNLTFNAMDTADLAYKSVLAGRGDLLANLMDMARRGVTRDLATEGNMA